MPQEGNLDKHLYEYNKTVSEIIPDINFNGLAIIDFESWRPIFRQNFGSLQPYKDLSISIERKLHPTWTKQRLENEASTRFEISGRTFVEQTILFSKKLRPKAKWGYYAFPYCFNVNGDSCSNQVQGENNRYILVLEVFVLMCTKICYKTLHRMKWMFNASDIILPSVYMQESTKTGIRQSIVQGRVKEALRMSKLVNNRSVYVYIRYVYTDSLKLLSEVSAFWDFIYSITLTK